MTATPLPAVWFPTVRCGSGSDVFTERLCAALNERGIRSEITWLPHRAEYAPWMVPVPKPPPWANIAHVNSWLHSRFIPAALPIITTIHHNVHDTALEPYKSPLQRLYHRCWVFPIERRNILRAQIHTAVSRYTARQVEQTFGCSDIIVIHNGINTETFTPGPERPPHRPFRLLYIGNWNLRKGVDLLAPILERLGPDFELCYTTGRNKRHACFSLPSNSRCLGRLTADRLVQAYREADALLFPSRLEGFGLVAAEAMACGLPVIAGNGSALPEIVEDGVTGLLCPKDDVDAFVSAARRLATDLQYWQAMRHAARQRAETHFGIGTQIDRYIELYKFIF